MWKSSPEGLQLAMRLSQLRSAVRIGLALAETCPTEESWDHLMADPEIQETLSAFAAIVDDIHADLDQKNDPDRVMDTIMEHHSRSLEALEPFCEAFSIDPNDLLVVLTA